MKKFVKEIDGIKEAIVEFGVTDAVIVVVHRKDLGPFKYTATYVLEPEDIVIYDLGLVTAKDIDEAVETAITALTIRMHDIINDVSKVMGEIWLQRRDARNKKWETSFYEGELI